MLRDLEPTIRPRSNPAISPRECRWIFVHVAQQAAGRRQSGRNHQHWPASETTNREADGVRSTFSRLQRPPNPRRASIVSRLDRATVVRRSPRRRAEEVSRVRRARGAAGPRRQAAGQWPPARDRERSSPASAREPNEVPFAPWSHPEVWEKLSYPFLHADRIKTPTLFLCGESDFNVPLLNSEQMYQALRSLGITTKLVIYPEQFHGLKKPSYMIDRYRRYLEWFAKWSS